MIVGGLLFPPCGNPNGRFENPNEAIFVWRPANPSVIFGCCVQNVLIRGVFVVSPALLPRPEEFLTSEVRSPAPNSRTECADDDGNRDLPVT